MAKKQTLTQSITPQRIFQRFEFKYILTLHQKDKLLAKLSKFIQPDQYFSETNCSVYFDRPDHYLAVNSLEKPLFKEKFRLRSYNTPTLNDHVFFEIKRKFNGVGYKRRTMLTLKNFYRYQKTGKISDLHADNLQIARELDYGFKFYALSPALYLAYDRESYCAKTDPAFRLTFDSNLRSREHDLRLEHGLEDTKPFFVRQNLIILEAKTLTAFPLWFTRALTELKLYPASFSKYGRVYQKLTDKTGELEKIL